MNTDVISAVLEAYDEIGVKVWFTNWVLADAPRRRRMEVGVLAEWSGQLPVLGYDPTKGQNDE